MRKSWLLLVVVAVFTLLSLSGERQSAQYLGIAADARNWLPLPVLPAALVWLGLSRAGVSARISWLIVGAVFGAIVVAVWGASPLSVVLGIPTMLLGAMAGHSVYNVMETPSERGVARPLCAFATVPVALGLVDLVLRSRIS